MWSMSLQGLRVQRPMQQHRFDLSRMLWRLDLQESWQLWNAVCTLTRHELGY